jgi:hypothetical protein
MFSLKFTTVAEPHNFYVDPDLVKNYFTPMILAPPEAAALVLVLKP